MGLVSKVSIVLKDLPAEERYTYRDQILRSSISIPSNIAEGSSRESSKDHLRFLRIALGSSFELETQLLLLSQDNIVNTPDLKNALILNEEVQKMLHAFMKTIKKK